MNTSPCPASFVTSLVHVEGITSKEKKVIWEW